MASWETPQQAEWRKWRTAVEHGTATVKMARSLKDPGNREVALRHIAPTVAQRRASAMRQAAIAATSPEMIDREFCW
jgi:hypothetical protein